MRDFNDKVKNLGTVLDQTLIFKHHIANLISGAYYKLKLLFPYRHVLNQKPCYVTQLYCRVSIIAILFKALFEQH